MKTEEPHTLVDALLAEQRTLTAVGKFSRLHDRHQSPLLEPHYRDLIPLTAPRPGEQYAFEVNLDQCSGCKGCVAACHSLNGLDEGEAWREVGALFGEGLVPEAHGGNRVVPLQLTVTTACHHCVEPGCLLGCPVQAYDKDPATGIVRHLDDQCIGCSYCVMKCPYEVPKYSARRGIVRKCDMCHDRLAVGEAPACVQACPNEAIRITVVGRESVRDKYRGRSVGGEKTLISKASDSLHGDTVLRGEFLLAPADAPSEWASEKNGQFLPDSPEPSTSLPTTRYVSAKSGTPLLAADHFNSRPAQAHWPLVWMLVLTQAGIGGLLTATLTGQGSGPGQWQLQIVLSFTLFLAGLVASVFHLGQPAKAWRVWLGWRTSWLSREAIALNTFFGIAVLAATAHWVPAPGWTLQVLPPLLLASGLLALFAQAMVYADTGRRFWRLASTLPRFLGTAAVLGSALQVSVNPGGLTALALLVVTLAKLAVEVSVLKHSDTDDLRRTQLRRTAFLQSGPLRLVLGGRLLVALAGGVFIPFALAADAITPGWAAVSVALCFGGEMAERYLFFTSVAPDKMPGQA